MYQIWGAGQRWCGCVSMCITFLRLSCADSILPTPSKAFTLAFHSQTTPAHIQAETYTRPLEEALPLPTHLQCRNTNMSCFLLMPSPRTLMPAFKFLVSRLSFPPTHHTHAQQEHGPTLRTMSAPAPAPAPPPQREGGRKDAPNPSASPSASSKTLAA